jgi:Zn-dependent oligopeptidase
VQRLNAHRPLYSALKEAMDTRAAAAEAAARAGGQATPSERDAEADRVGAALLHDFVRGGVHLPQEQRDRVEELAEKVTQAGIDFCANLTNPSLSETFSVNQAVLARMPKRVRL